MMRAPKAHVVPSTGLAVILFFRFLVPAGSEEYFDPELLRAEELIGYAAVDGRSTPIGYIVDLVIRGDGNVPYCIVQFENDVSGNGVRHGSYLIPMEAGRMDRHSRTFFLEGIDRSRFTDYPDILGDEPGVSGEQDLSGLFEWWSREQGLFLNTDQDERSGFREFRGPEFIDGVLASDLEDFRIVCGEGREVGRVEGIMLSMPDSRVVYIALRTEDPLSGGEKMIAVPPGRMSIDTERKHLILDLDREELERLEGFRLDWPVRPDPALIE